MIWPSLANSVTLNIAFLLVSICFSINRCLYISSKKNMAYKIFFKDYNKKDLLPTLNALIFYATRLMWGHVTECRGCENAGRSQRCLNMSQTKVNSKPNAQQIHGVSDDAEPRFTLWLWTPTVHTTVCEPSHHTVPTSTADSPGTDSGHLYMMNFRLLLESFSGLTKM